MKVLCIPDIHGRNFWRQAIFNNIGKVDKVIFLGDYLDPYVHEIEECPESMECKFEGDSFTLLHMLNDIVSLKKNEPDKYILLTGNHTDSYIWSKFTAATRTDYDNWEKYHKFFKENLTYFNFVWIQNKCIFSHAGITEGWAFSFLADHMKYDESALGGNLVLEAAEVLQDTPLENFNKEYIKAISHISRYRYGDYLYGSCEWADLREHIDMNKSTQDNLITKGVDGIYQIFGHTQLKGPLITEKWACLDCRKAFIIDTNTFEISEV